MRRLLRETWWLTKLAVVLGLMAWLTVNKAKAEELPPGGQFYIGAFAGMTVFDSTVTIGGVKPIDQVELVDQGGDAFQGGIRAGWINSAAFHFGVEVEGLLASGRSRAVIPGVGTYSRDVTSGVGAFARVGWRTQGNAIMFLRPGIQYLNTSSGWEAVPAIGIGAEIPIGRNWAARLDVSYAWGNQVEYYNGTIGVIWRF
jgi:hypothetical protein